MYCSVGSLLSVDEIVISKESHNIVVSFACPVIVCSYNQEVFGSQIEELSVHSAVSSRTAFGLSQIVTEI